jgi:hypothetical protein
MVAVVENNFIGVGGQTNASADRAAKPGRSGMQHGKTPFSVILASMRGGGDMMTR